MSMFKHLYHGSLLSDESLLYAREYYQPQPSRPTAADELARWTTRLTVQPELACARELAGLSDAELAALDAEFVRSPVRRRTDRLRHAIPLGAVLCAIGALGLGLHAAFFSMSAGPLSVVQLLNIAVLAVGVALVAIGMLAAFGMVSLDTSYGKVGLYVGVLDEQHPWLYKALLLLPHEAAQAYRLRVLNERGALRGVDCIMMRETAQAHENVELTRPARDVAEQLQQRVVPVPDGVAATEPRLVSVAPTGEEAGQGGAGRSVRAFGPSGVDRRLSN